MASLSAALDLLVARIETHTPARDPQIVYVHDRQWASDRPDRTFTVLPPVELTPFQTSLSNPFESTAIVRVYYRHTTEMYMLLKEVCDDAEDLFERVSYYPGSEWAQSGGYGFTVSSITIDRRGEGLTLSFTVTIYYNAIT